MGTNAYLINNSGFAWHFYHFTASITSTDKMALWGMQYSNRVNNVKELYFIGLVHQFPLQGIEIDASSFFI